MFGNIRSLAAPVERTRADYPVACEQALLFGQAKRASRERFAARSRVLTRLISLVSLAQIGELARRLTILTSEHQLTSIAKAVEIPSRNSFRFFFILYYYKMFLLHYNVLQKKVKKQKGRTTNYITGKE